MICQSVNSSCKIAVENAGFVFAYFCGGHKNNFRLQFHISFKIGNKLSKKDVNQQVNILNNTLMNIFSNFVQNKVITIDHRDPPWMTDTIKSKIQWQNSILKNYQKSTKTTADHEILQQAVTELHSILMTFKSSNICDLS